MNGLRIVLVALSACLLVPHSASAQRSEAETRRMAREAFDEGRRLIDDARLARGRDKLLESFSLLPTAPTAYNLAIAYRGTGEAVAGVALLERLLAGEFGELPPAKVEEARQLLAELSAMTARLVVANGGDAPLVLTLDAEEDYSLDAGSQREIVVDLGRHALSARGDGRLPFSESIRLGAGSVERIDVDLEPLPVRRRTGLIVGLVLGGVALATAAVLTAVLVDRRADPTSDDVFPAVRLP